MTKEDYSKLWEAVIDGDRWDIYDVLVKLIERIEKLEERNDERL